MRYLRPFELDGEPGSVSNWLISPEDEIGCSIRVKRGGGAETTASSVPRERVAVVFAGSARLTTTEGTTEVAKGGAIFIPANTAGAVNGSAESTWIEIEALDTVASYGADSNVEAQVIPVNQDSFVNFEDSGFWFYPLIDRSAIGSESIRLNTIQMEDRVGSPDWHIHAFAQMYLIQEGEMTVDIGRSRQVAGPNTLVLLPAGVVHRNFNVSGGTEKHVALLVPEPPKDAIFDYAVTIHENEAEMMKELP